MFKGYRFDGCFTGLHVLSLVEYTKVLTLDLDVAVVGSPYDLLRLPAPAALRRGSKGCVRGSRTDSRRFFCGEVADSEETMGWEWGQQGGINAGVMALQLMLDAPEEVGAVVRPLCWRQGAREEDRGPPRRG